VRGCLSTEVGPCRLGIGSRLLGWILQRAKARQVGALYLLTCGASAFFCNHGFSEVHRARVPPARETPGVVGVESVRDAQGLGITVSYFRDLSAIAQFRELAEHRRVQDSGRRMGYKRHSVCIARVEHAYGFARD
jgi:heme-degrading monooxygenase HmoA